MLHHTFYYFIFLLASTNAQVYVNTEPLAQSNVTCLGDPELKLPVFDDWDPNSYSLQELCVAYGEGGSSSGKNVGGWCDDSPYGISAPRPGVTRLRSITFGERRFIDTMNLSLYNPRLLLYCQSRCFCNIDADDLRVKPRGLNIVEKERIDVNMWRTMAYKVKVDRVDDWRGTGPTRPYGFAQDVVDSTHETGFRAFALFRRFFPSASLWKRLDFREVYAPISERITEMRNPRESHWGLSEPILPVVFDRINNVICDGPLPDFPIPGPYNQTDFSNLQEFCAYRGSGGKWFANAGAYCHRNDRNDAKTNGYQKRSLWFSDEMTPRTEWTWNNFRASASIRFHCRKYCSCQFKNRPGEGRVDPGLKVWRFATSTNWMIDQHIGGEFKLSMTGSSPAGNSDTSETGWSDSGSSGSAYSLSLLPPQTNGPVSGTCGADGKQFCPMAWPTELLGPIPRSPPGLDLSPSDPVPADTCSVSCNGPKQCADASTSTCPFQRRCAVNYLRETVGVDLGSVITAVATQCVRIHSRPRPGRLGGRAAEPDGQQEVLAWPCACNASYVSHACCLTGDGLVWEEPHLLLAKLDV